MNFGLSSRQDFLLNGLSQSQRTAAEAQQQITTGFRLRTAVDDPARVEDLMRVQSRLAGAEQVSKNLNILRAEVGAGASALQSGIRLLDNAVTLGSQVFSGTFAADKREAMSQQIEDLHSRMVALSSTTANGRYLFSGDLDGAPSYAVNLSNPNGVDRLAMPTAALLAELPDGSRYPIGRTAQDLFDRRNPDDSLATENVFAALTDLRTAVASGTDADVSAALGRIKSASSYLNQQAAGYEASQSRLIAAQSESDESQAQWKIRLSEVRDADVASAILRMQQMDTQMKAALSSEAQFPKMTLFDFLR